MRLLLPNSSFYIQIEVFKTLFNCYRTSRVQSTVGGSRVESTMDNSSADPGKAGSTQLDRNSSMNTPLVGQTKESDAGEAKGAGAGKKIQLSDLQSILGNLSKFLSSRSPFKRAIKV